MSVVDTEGIAKDGADPKVFTWHLLAASILTARGEVDLGNAMAWVSNDTIEDFIESNLDSFHQTLAIQPDYAGYLLFSPRVASNMLGIFGATVDPDVLLRVAKKHGVITAVDAEGRRGIACKFARSLALVIASKNAMSEMRTEPQRPMALAS